MRRGLIPKPNLNFCYTMSLKLWMIFISRELTKLLGTEDTMITSKRNEYWMTFWRTLEFSVKENVLKETVEILKILRDQVKSYTKMVSILSLNMARYLQEIFAEAAIRRCSEKKAFLNILWNKISHKMKYLVNEIDHLGQKQKHPQEVFYKKVLLKIYEFTGKHICQSQFFNKVVRLRPTTWLKWRLWHRRFLLNFMKFLGTPFYRTLPVAASVFARDGKFHLWDILFH